MAFIDAFKPVVTDIDEGAVQGTLLNEDAVEVILTHLSRLDDLAVAALERAEGNPVLQTLLTEIREKAQAIHDLFEK